MGQLKCPEEMPTGEPISEPLETANSCSEPGPKEEPSNHGDPQPIVSPEECPTKRRS